MANIGGALIFYLLVVKSAIAGYAALWFVILVIISLARMAITFYSQNRIDDGDPGRFLKPYFVYALLLGIAWGYVHILQYQLGNPDVHNFAFLLFFGLVAVSMSTMSAWLPALFAFVIPQFIILLAVVILEGADTSNYTALALHVCS